MNTGTSRRSDARAEARMIMTDPALRGLIGVMETFREKHREMPLQMAQTLLEVAARPGITPNELITAVGISQSAMSRNLQTLGDGSSKGAVGMGLVEAWLDRNDYRATQLHLTAEGRAYVMRLLGHLRDGPPRSRNEFPGAAGWVDQSAASAAPPTAG